MVESRGQTGAQTRDFIASASLSAAEAARAKRSHWGIESVHWVLDVIVKDDQSRLRRGHGARNMAFIRRFAIRAAPRRSFHRNNPQSRRMEP